MEPDTSDGSGSDHSKGRQSAPRRSVHEWGAKPRPPPKARGAASCIAARSEPQVSEGKSWRRMTGVQPVKRTVRP